MCKYPIEMRDVTIQYNDGMVPALEHVTMKIKQGEYLAVIGPNGGGKTTLLKAILGLVPLKTGEILFNGKLNFSERIGYVPQVNTADMRFPATVFKIVLMGCYDAKQRRLFHKYSAEDKATAKKVIKQIGISALSNKQISQLSGGEYQKVLIARALATGSNILVFDEPTANVDSAARASIYKILKDLKGNHTIILVTHDILAVSQDVDTLACINETLVYHGLPEMSQTTVDEMYGCPVDIIAHGTAHRVLRKHEEE